MNKSWPDLLIAKARDGDAVAARALLRYLETCLERGNVVPPNVVDYFTPTLKQMAAGLPEAGDKKSARKKSAKFERDYKIAREVWKLEHLAVDSLPFWNSDKKTGAYSTVSKRYPEAGGEDNVAGIYAKMKALVEAEFLDDQITNDRSSRQLEADMQLAFAQLTEALKKHGKN